MDSVEQRNQPFKPYSIAFVKPALVHRVKQHPHDAEKHQLIAQIRNYLSKKAALEAKHHTLENNCYDLRKLLEIAGNQNSQYVQHLEEEIQELGEEQARYKQALKVAHANGRHLSNCAMFWKEFVQ